MKSYSRIAEGHELHEKNSASAIRCASCSSSAGTGLSLLSGATEQWCIAFALYSFEMTLLYCDT